METKKLFNKLKKHVEKNGMTEVAFFLGYSTTTTIHHWLNREPVGIPKHQVKQVQQFFSEREQV